MNYRFYFYSLGLGVSLAADAFSVSLSNGLREKRMRARRMCFIAGVFAFFQFLMPILGWLSVSTLLSKFTVAERIVPWVAFTILALLGVRMLFGAKEKEPSKPMPPLGTGTLLLQGIASSIDALSSGLAIADYSPSMAFLTAAIIALVTFILCLGALLLGERFGTLLGSRAQTLGGIILIAIALEILITGT